MGSGGSKEENLSRDPVKFGESGDVGPLIGVYHDHNLTIPRDRVTERRDSVVAVSRDNLDVYNRVTADRKVRVRASSPITCASYAVRSTIGPVAVAGTAEGEVAVFELISGSFFKAIRTVEKGVPVLSRKHVGVSAVVCHPSMMDAEASGIDTAFAGHTDGSVVSFKVMNGELIKEFKAPAVEAMDAPKGGEAAVALPRGGEVASLCCVLQPDSGRLILCVAYRNGSLFAFDATTADPLSHFKAAPGITAILPSSRLNVVLVCHENTNAVVLWDLTTGTSLRFDFTHELEAVHKQATKMTCAAFDDHRGVLFTGSNDGSVFVRRLSGAPGASLGAPPQYSMNLLRFCCPAPTSGASAILTTMWYDSALDRLYTGDGTGVGRVVKKVTGIAFEATELGTVAVAEGKFRTRGASIALGEPSGALPTDKA